MIIVLFSEFYCCFLNFMDLHIYCLLRLTSVEFGKSETLGNYMLLIYCLRHFSICFGWAEACNGGSINKVPSFVKSRVNLLFNKGMQIYGNLIYTKLPTILVDMCRCTMVDCNRLTSIVIDASNFCICTWPYGYIAWNSYFGQIMFAFRFMPFHLMVSFN